MKVFKDEKRELDWVSFNNINDPGCKEAIDEINSWSDNENIKKFIVDGMEVGNFLSRLYAQEDPAFMNYATDGKNEEVRDFLYFFYEKGKRDSLAGVTLLSNNFENDQVDVCYLVVNPNIQGKGIGTRFVTSLKDNLQTLTKRETNNVITARVDDENVASLKLFSKVCKPVKKELLERWGEEDRFLWFFTSREREKEN